MNTFLYLCVVIIILLLLLCFNSIKRPPNYPPGPKWFPYIGNTYQLRKISKTLGGQHLAFENWSKLYKSPILGLKLGSEYVVVALTYDLVRQIHTRNEFQGRPDNFFLRLRTMGTRLGITCTDGPLWVEHRNFTVRHLKQAGYGRYPMEVQIQNEAIELISVINDFGGNPIWPGSFLAPSVINVLWSLTTGKRINRDDKRLEILLKLLQQRSKAFDLCGGILSQMPWIRFLAPEKSGYNLIQQFNKKLHAFFMETINDHKNNYSPEKVNDDLIYAYITEMKKDLNNTFTDIQLTMIILDIFIAGSQTTSNTLDLALMMMIIRPDIYENVKNEIDLAYSTKSLDIIGDKVKLSYTEAVLMEVQRFFHITPITGPRRTLNATTLHGYSIPKNTTILIGLRSVLMDNEYWGDPEIFRPERFLDANMMIISKEYFMPFGQGKRRCLGDSLARACLQKFFVTIIKNFNLELPEDTIPPSTTLLPGITLSPHPYKIRFNAR